MIQTLLIIIQKANLILFLCLTVQIWSQRKKKFRQSLLLTLDIIHFVYSTCEWGSLSATSFCVILISYSQRVDNERKCARTRKRLSGTYVIYIIKLLVFPKSVGKFLLNFPAVERSFPRSDSRCRVVRATRNELHYCNVKNVGGEIKGVGGMQLLESLRRVVKMEKRKSSRI